jgi:hypothetical protein
LPQENIIILLVRIKQSNGALKGVLIYLITLFRVLFFLEKEGGVS